ncbi:MAG: DUF1273 family protein [Clostridia bacterium]|nr:DUF1273 family protein [Clostridia bacterium]
MQQLCITTTEYKSCAITGHRDLPKNLSREKLKADLRALIQAGVQCFYNGLAVGFDLLTAELLIELRLEFPDLHLCGCIPFHGQDRYYSAEDKRRYYKVLEECDDVVVFCSEYQRGCYFIRNDYMVEKADLLFAYCLSKSGGAAYTVRAFQKKKGKENVRFFV